MQKKKKTRVIIQYLISLLLFVDTGTSEPLRHFKQQNNILFQLSTFYDATTGMIDRRVIDQD